MQWKAVGSLATGQDSCAPLSVFKADSALMQKNRLLSLQRNLPNWETNWFQEKLSRLTARCAITVGFPCTCFHVIQFQVVMDQHIQAQ